MKAIASALQVDPSKVLYLGKDANEKIVKGINLGLLTVDEILLLRLNAEWVVLSACNTAAGAGQGAEALSAEPSFTPAAGRCWSPTGPWTRQRPES